MKINRLRKFFLGTVLAFSTALLPLSQAIAAEPTHPKIAIEQVSNQLKEKLKDKDFIHDFKQVNVFVLETIEPHVDFDRIAALVLGKLWRQVTADEKAQFTKEFRTLLIRTYSRAFIGFKNWSVAFLPLKIKPDAKKIIIKTEISQPTAATIGISYRMVLAEGQWKVYDIIIEGVSLVTNYRTSIKNEFRKAGSIGKVIEKLAKRNAKALSTNNDS